MGVSPLPLNHPNYQLSSVVRVHLDQFHYQSDSCPFLANSFNVLTQKNKLTLWVFTLRVLGMGEIVFSLRLSGSIIIGFFVLKGAGRV